MKKTAVFLVMIAVIVLSACAPASKNEVGKTVEMPAGAPSFQGAMPIAPAAPAPAQPARDAAESSFAGSGGDTAALDRLVIKNATLSIVVPDPAVSMDAVAKLADEMGGWVVTSNLYKITTNEGIETPQASISIRIPADRLTEALTRIKGQVEDPNTDVRSENISGEDVTAQYTDLQSRKANLEQAEAALREIMASATKTEDVLNVFNQLTQVRGEIEVLKGQIKYYEESSSFSAINVELISQASIKPITVAGWQPQGVARDALQALINAGKLIVNILIWFVILVLPILIVFYLVIRVAIWLVKKLFFKKKNVNDKDEEKNIPPVEPKTN